MSENSAKPIGECPAVYSLADMDFYCERGVDHSHNPAGDPNWQAHTACDSDLLENHTLSWTGPPYPKPTAPKLVEVSIEAQAPRAPLHLMPPRAGGPVGSGGF